VVSGARINPDSQSSHVRIVIRKGILRHFPRNPNRVSPGFCMILSGRISRCKPRISHDECRILDHILPGFSIIFHSVVTGVCPRLVCLPLFLITVPENTRSLSDPEILFEKSEKSPIRDLVMCLSFKFRIWCTYIDWSSINLTNKTTFTFSLCPYADIVTESSPVISRRGPQIMNVVSSPSCRSPDPLLTCIYPVLQNLREISFLLFDVTWKRTYGLRGNILYSFWTPVNFDLSILIQ
jgi:hypothetical protein